VHQVGKKEDYHYVRMHGKQNVKKEKKNYPFCFQREVQESIAM